MALAAMRPGCRVLVAGDDKQLPPVRAIHEQEVDGRRIGGSLYDFLKAAEVAEFALEETFRLNAPLTAFPKAKFYAGRYRSAVDVAERRLELREDWRKGLSGWECVALDPEVPVCVLLYDAAPAGTSNAFEVSLVARLVNRFRVAMAPGPTEAEDDSGGVLGAPPRSRQPSPGPECRDPCRARAWSGRYVVRRGNRGSHSR